MLFNSYAFIFLFLPVVAIVFFQLARVGQQYASAWLALSSLFFYGYWNPDYLGLLLGSIVGNYSFGTWIGRAVNRHDAIRGKKLLFAAVTANLLLLGYFKYANFFMENMDALTGAHWLIGKIVLPLGISFFTFTQIAFLVDVHQGKVKEYNFMHYLLFVTYFPHLIAGPILHHQEMMPQFAQRRNYRPNWDNIATGLLLFTLGLCKKVLWADSFAPYANDIFKGIHAGALPTIYEAWFGALAYTMQIYFDFSGYTDMALGIAMIFNIRLPFNFDSPYKSTSIIEFWRRWHMTLSRFLRDYLYIPLGGNRKGMLRRYLNLMATMLLGGLWHGAGWTFVLWGMLHGIYLTLNHLWRDFVTARIPFRFPGWMACTAGGIVTFVAVVTAWVFFRASDLPQAIIMLKAMYGIEARPIAFDAVLHGNLLTLSDLSGRDLAKLVAAGLAWIWLLPNSNTVKFHGANHAAAILQAGLVVGMIVLVLDQFGTYSPFLYFQF